MKWLIVQGQYLCDTKSRQGFSAQCYWQFGPENSLIAADWYYPVHHKVFSSIPGLYPLDASGIPHWSKLSSNIAYCPLGIGGRMGQNCPPVKNHSNSSTHTATIHTTRTTVVIHLLLLLLLLMKYRKIWSKQTR